MRNEDKRNERERKINIGSGLREFFPVNALQFPGPRECAFISIVLCFL